MASKPKLILTPVGALIVQRTSDENKAFLQRIKNEDLMTLREGQAKGQSAFEKAILAELKQIDLETELGLQKASPEIKSLAKMGTSRDDQVLLYASETSEGILSARIIREFCRQVWGCSTAMEVITGLQVQDAGRFRSVGVQRYVQSVVQQVTNPQNQYGREIILNATAGFKALVPYTTLIGLLFQVPVQYIFESSSVLLNLPPLPVNFDFDFYKVVEPFLQRVERESAIPENEVLTFDSATREKLLPLLEPMNGEFTLSALGLIVYERYKSPPPLLPSTRKAVDKDHTRDFSQETHRSAEFENFKSRLAESQWVDEFWYLKGTDETRRQVKPVGDELHVAYGGIELRVKTTAQHPSHYATIIPEIERLLK